jgi:two-component system response regulator
MKRSTLILLVDDNPDDVELTVRAFRRSACASEIIALADGEAALTFLFETATTDPDRVPSVVLLDLKMPRVDGHDVLRAMRADARTKYIPVVVLSSSGEPSDIARSYELGANSFIQKPVDFDTFVDTAQQLSRYWLELNQRAASASTS